jgi:hypothetical protein
LIMSVHLSTISIRFHSISEEHAPKLSGWKRYDFLKLVRDERSTIRWFRIQRFNDVISTWSRFMLSSMNRHWHLFKMIVAVPLYSSNIQPFARLIYWLSRSDRC